MMVKMACAGLLVVGASAAYGQPILNGCAPGVANAVAEAIAFRETCDKVFPDLKASTRQSISVLEAALPLCYQAVSQSDQWRESIAAGSAMMQMHFSAATAKECTTEFPESIANFLVQLKQAK